MSYIEKILINNEKIIYETWESYFLLIWYKIEFFLWLIIFLNSSKNHNLFIFVAIFFMFFWFSKTIDFFFTEFVITNKRVIYKKWLFSKKIIELQKKQIEWISINQWFFWRIFWFWTIIISWTWWLKTEFENIRYPIKFRQNIYELIDKSF